jgi:hypothetical protein
MDWIPAGVTGLVASVGGWLLSWRISSAKQDGRHEAEGIAREDRDEGFRQDLRDFRDEFRAGVAEMRTVSVATSKLQASQDVVNQVTAKAIESLVGRLDRHEEKLNDHAATLKLVTELLTREQRKA